MKHTIVYLLLLYSNLNLMNSFLVKQNITRESSLVQNVDTIDLDETTIEKYLKAYQYIASDSLYRSNPVCICISSRTICSYYTFFIDKLKENGSLREKSDITILYDKDTNSNSKYICWNGIIQNETKSKCEFILSFSEIKENDLFAEIKIKEWMNTPFGESIIYFFRFNLDGTFKFIYRTELSGL